MHSIVFVLLPADTVNIREKTTALLAPYHLGREVPPHKEYFSEAEVARWSQQLHTRDLTRIAKYLKNSGGVEAGVDERGLYEMTTFNRRGRFDYWTSAEVFETKSGLPEVDADLAKSVCLVSELPESKDSIPYSIVTPEGEWVCASDFSVVPLHDFAGRSELNAEAQAKWEQEARKLLLKYKNHWVFALDVHS